MPRSHVNRHAVAEAPNVERPFCQYCARPLRRYRWRNSATLNPDGNNQWGGYGDNLFCGLTCGWRFAVAVMQRVDHV